jgi:hypothetical protein
MLICGCKTDNRPKYSVCSQTAGKKMEKYKHIIQYGTALAALLCGNAFATSGIAVSEFWPGDKSAWNGCCGMGDIVRYNIENDKIVSHDTLVTKGVSRQATIDVTGKYVAFYHIPDHESWSNYGTYDNVYISVVSIDGGEVKNLVKVTSIQSNANERGWISWPAGDWIYYNLGNKDYGDPKSIRRVNYKTGKDEAVVRLSNPIWQWTLSADASRLCADMMEPHTNYVWYDLAQGDGQLCDNCPLYFKQGRKTCCVAYGCNNAIAPSGNYYIGTTDAAHVHIQLYRHQDLIDSVKDSYKTISTQDYNAWCVNCEGISYICGDQTITVGSGFQGNRMSVNSDEWICIGLGHKAGGGRFGDCGSNQVLCNWKREKTIMVSFNPLSCPNAEDAQQCSPHVDNQTKTNAAGTFWVSGPAEEINEDLRQYVDVTGNSNPGAGILRQKLPVNQQTGIVLYDMQGKLIARTSLRNAVRFIRRRPQSVYIMRSAEGTRVMVHSSVPMR